MGFKGSFGNYINYLINQVKRNCAFTFLPSPFYSPGEEVLALGEKWKLKEQTTVLQPPTPTYSTSASLHVTGQASDEQM